MGILNILFIALALRKQGHDFCFKAEFQQSSIGNHRNDKQGKCPSNKEKRQTARKL